MMKIHEKNVPLWISRCIDSRVEKLKSPWLTSLLIFALPFDIIMLSFILIRQQHIESNYFFPLISVIIWPSLVPYLIWFYERKVMKEFFNQIKDLIAERSQLLEISEEVNSFFVRKYWFSSIPWMAFGLFVYLSSSDSLSLIGIHGVKDFWFWFFSILVLWVAYLCGIGCWGVITTIFTITKISKYQFIIDPLHKDSLGGLSGIGQYALRTTFLFSSGSLILPIIFQGGFENSVFNNNAIFLVIVYVILILVSFLYPTATVNSKAQKLREKILEDLGKKYKLISNNIEMGKIQNQEKQILYFELFRVRSIYKDYSELKLYPFKTEFITELSISILFPIILTIIQQKFR